MSRGPKPFRPTEEQRRLVRAMVLADIPIDRMRLRMVNETTLRFPDHETFSRAFARELAEAKEDVATAITNGFIANATRNGSLKAQMFFLERRAGWVRPNAPARPEANDPQRHIHFHAGAAGTEQPAVDAIGLERSRRVAGLIAQLAGPPADRGGVPSPLGGEASD